MRLPWRRIALARAGLLCYCTPAPESRGMEVRMRFKSRTWFLLSLLLFAAAFWTWRYAEKYSAARRHAAVAPPTTATPAAVAQPSAAPPLINTATRTETNKPASYRLSNTRQNAGQLA